MMCACIGGLAPAFAGKAGTTDTGGVKGSFSGRHNGLRDCIYDEAVRAGCAAHKEMELGTEHGLALKQEQFMKQQSRKAQM